MRAPNHLIDFVVEGSVATVTLNRPEKLNAVTFPMLRKLAEAGQRAASDDQVKAVVVKGNGRAFCSGLDVNSFTEITSSSIEELIDVAQSAVSVWTSISKPVIAAVHGYAIGAGLQIALGADIRMASPDTIFSAYEVNYGLIPDMGGHRLVAQLAGPARAKELIWTGRKFSSHEALSWGLISDILPDPGVAALELATDLTSKSPLVLAHTKSLLADPGFEQSLTDAKLAQVECIKQR